MFSSALILAGTTSVVLIGGLSGASTGFPMAASEQVEAAGAAGAADPDAATTSTRSDLLPGADLVTEEVEPGVLRVVSDRHRELARPIMSEVREIEATSPAVAVAMLAYNSRVVAGADGSVWLFGPDGFFRLGDGETHAWSERFTEVFTGHDDGALWELVAPLDWLQWLDFTVPADGRPMAFTQGSPIEGLVLEGDEWMTLDPLGDGSRMRSSYAAPDGTVWVGGSRKRPNGFFKIVVARLDNGVWTELEPLSSKRQTLYLVGTDPDGALWAVAGLRVMHYTDQGWVDTGFDSNTLRGIQWPAVLAGLSDDATSIWPWTSGYPGGPDVPATYSPGRIWYAASPDEVPERWEDRLQMPHAGCDGLVAVDDAGSHRYLAGLCVYDIDLAQDGSVWVLANDWAGTRVEPEHVGPVELYVITPGARCGDRVDHGHHDSPIVSGPSRRRLRSTPMQHPHLTRPCLDCWVTVEVWERDGRYMATADLGEDSRNVGVGETLHEAVRAAQRVLGEPHVSEMAAGSCDELP